MTLHTTPNFLGQLPRDIAERAIHYYDDVFPEPRTIQEGDEFWLQAWKAASNNSDHPIPPRKKEYWSKPSHFPPTCWVMTRGGQSCKQVTEISHDGFFFASSSNITFSVLENMRWGESPFDSFDDGKECLVEQ